MANQQATQAGIASLASTNSAAAWAFLDIADPSTMQKFILALTALIQQFGRTSSIVAAKYYGEERAAAGVRGTFTVKPAPPADIQKIDKSVRWATKDLWTPQPDVEAAKTKVQGVVEKNVLDSGRSTVINAVHADRKAKAWARVPEPGACAFCVLLSTRGAVYRSEHSGNFRSHDHCRCHVEPVFTQYEPSAQIREWQQLYRDSTRDAHGPKASRLAFRQALEG